MSQQDPGASGGYREGRLGRLFPSPATIPRRRDAERADAEYGLPAEPGWRAIDWRDHLHAASIDGTSVRYVDLGEGKDPPVVFVHGLSGSWQNWLENLPAVARHRRAIALDLPGFGRSEMPTAGISITGYATTVERLCATLELAAVALVGNSMGGFTAAELAIRHPDRVERLVLVDAAGISTVTAQRTLTLQLAKLLESSSRSREGALRILNRPGFVQLAFGAIARYPTRIAKDLLAEQLTVTGAPGFLDAAEALLGYDFTERLAEIACPTLVVQGSEDVLVPLGDAYEFERRIPQATTLILEDTGHVPMLERPRTFNRALLEFLAQTGDPADPSRADEPTLSEARERPV